MHKIAVMIVLGEGGVINANGNAFVVPSYNQRGSFRIIASKLLNLF